ncbi:DNA-binding protein [Auraticoccus sp. F435]|uniref:DNA-binding protein n=1 Tax=Auraticoccus cholistanensis TaxID=2656650 RepID=A0A6A9USL9_9ACTN|nr:DNA-binding protein [Auraticoccus cholistanensis]MVA75813.1 DNA-binding protein [Auraticoccus cholistanensis]
MSDGQASPFSPSDPGRDRSRRTHTALFRITERFAATPDARARSRHPEQVDPQEAVHLVTALAAGSAPPRSGEPPVDTDDLAAALTLVPEARAQLDGLEASLIGVARGRGMTWAQIAFALGLRSAQAAQQRSDRLAARVDDEDR